MQKGALKKTIEGVNGPEIQKLLDNIWQKLSRAKTYWHSPDPVGSVEEFGLSGEERGLNGMRSKTLRIRRLAKS